MTKNEAIRLVPEYKPYPDEVSFVEETRDAFVFKWKSKEKDPFKMPMPDWRYIGVAKSNGNISYSFDVDEAAEKCLS